MALGGLLPAADPFGGGKDRQVFLNNVSGSAFARLKRRHALESPSFDVGLFGNSRSLDVGANQVGLAGCSFFNFSLSGESLRANVAFLESLAAAGKAPKTALISVDNFELQYYANPLYPPAGERWRLAARDIWAGIMRPDIPLREVGRMMWRHLYTESRLFKFEFEFDVLSRTIAGVLNSPDDAFGRPLPSEVGYRSDGSRMTKPVGPGGGPNDIMTPAPSQIMPGYLDYDLERLKRLAGKGIRVVVYESALEPSSARALGTNPSAQAARARKQFLASCGRYGLACVPAPLALPGPALTWRDHSHAPAASLGAYLTRLLEDRGGACVP